MSRHRLPTLLALVTALSLIVAAPALAQSAEGTDEPAEEGTVASVEGTVLQSDTGTLLVRTDDGDMRFVIRETEHNPEYLDPGTRVRIWYRGSVDTEFRVTRVALPEEVPTEPMTDEESTEGGIEPTTTEDAAASEDTAAEESTMATSEETPAEETPTQEREGAGQQESLPQTAGMLPLAAAIGLGALAGGLGLRATRRRR